MTPAWTGYDNGKGEDAGPGRLSGPLGYADSGSVDRMRWRYCGDHAMKMIRQISAWERIVWLFIGAAIAFAVIALILILMLPTYPAHAHDHARPDLDSWYPTLESRKGPCCDGPGVDATHLDDPDWETTGSADVPYRVHLPEGWIDVPATAVVHAPNRDGRALVWPMYINGARAVRCFLPGTLS